MRENAEKEKKMKEEVEKALEEKKKTELEAFNRRLQEQRKLSMSMPNLFFDQDDEAKYRKLMNTVAEFIPIVQQFGY
jgi:ATP phosphoribosyltransferase regulatory subunit HisZ